MYERVREKYEREMADWKDMKYLAERVLAGEEEVYVEIVQEINPLETLEWIEGFSSFEVHSPNVVSATINVRGNDIVPAERKRQLKSGKLSTTDMPKTKYYGYHQDYVCSSLLRAAREISAVLPTTMVVVTASTDMLDPSTGHIKQQPIVSAAIASDTMDRLNLDRIDPSDALSNFVHEMAFRKTKGFRPISPIDPAQFVDS